MYNDEKRVRSLKKVLGHFFIFIIAIRCLFIPSRNLHFFQQSYHITRIISAVLSGISILYGLAAGIVAYKRSENRPGPVINLVEELSRAASSVPVHTAAGLDWTLQLIIFALSI